MSGSSTRTAPGCGTHAGLGTELRAVAVLALDRLGPMLDGMRTEPDADAPDADAPGTADAAGGGQAGSARATPCAVCPFCAVVALLRGERPELAVRLAEHAAGLLVVLQAALHEGDPAAWPPPASAPAPSPAPSRRVQHIRVERSVPC